MKIVIYTVLTGGYDNLQQPLVVDDRFEYICFSNDIIIESVGVWKIKPIQFKIDDNQRLSRYPKIKPYEFLQDFEFSVYMDANIIISKSYFYDLIINLIDRGEIFSGVKNGWRDCLYDEGFRCILSRLDSPLKIIKQMRYIKSQNFPHNFGMYEANIIFRSHNHPLVILQSDMWWSIVFNNAKRDQLALSYTLWKQKIDWCYFFPDGTNTHNNDNVIFIEHPHRSTNKNYIAFARKPAKLLKPLMYALYRLLIGIKYE